MRFEQFYDWDGARMGVWEGERDVYMVSGDPN